MILLLHKPTDKEFRGRYVGPDGCAPYYEDAEGNRYALNECEGVDEPGAVWHECPTCKYRYVAGMHGGHSCTGRLKSLVDDNDAFMAYMVGELAEFKCCCEDAEHASTPPYMWPELIHCIRMRAVKDKTAALQAKFDELLDATLQFRTDCELTNHHGNHAALCALNAVLNPLVEARGK